MIPKKDDLPAMPFYVGDWLKCPEVRSLQPDHRGLWFDLICYLWESTDRGVMVKPNGKPYSDNEIIRMVGLDNQNSGIWLTILIENGVCSRREDGAVYSKRMVKDQKLRVIRREIGRKGGNPNLLVNHIDKTEDNQFIENANENENVNENKDKKIRYLESVFLTEGQHAELANKIGIKKRDEYIEKLNNYIQSRGKQYKSHYHTILSWWNKDGKPIEKAYQKVPIYQVNPEEQEKVSQLISQTLQSMTK